MKFEIKESGDEIVVESRQSPMQYFYATIYPNKRLAHIFEIHIEKDKRGQGHGKSAVKDFIELCKTYDVKHITGIPNQPAQPFWKSNDFDIIPRDQKHDMDKSLPYSRSLSPLMIKELSFREADILDRLPGTGKMGEHWAGKTLFGISSENIYTDSKIMGFNHFNNQMNLADGTHLKTDLCTYYGEDGDYVYFSSKPLVGLICYIKFDTTGASLYGKILNVRNGVLSFAGESRGFLLKQLVEEKITKVNMNGREVTFS